MAFSIVRILDITTTGLSVLFNEDVDPEIGIENVSIVPSVSSINNARILSLVVENNVINITFAPIYDNVKYKLSFFSTQNYYFRSLTGNIISEDGSRNCLFFVSPGSENIYKEQILENLPTNIYQTDDNNSLIKDLMSSYGVAFQKIADGIDTIQSANYLSITQTDERKTRGSGPYDRLNNGGAFDIIRVGPNPSGTDKYGCLQFGLSRVSSFNTRNGIKLNSIISSVSYDPISVQSEDVINEVVSVYNNEFNSFSGLKIKVSKKPVIQVISIGLKRNNIFIEYDIETYGYILKNDRYDTKTCGINVNLLENEIELSQLSVPEFGGTFVYPESSDEIYISYVYKNLGKNIDSESIILSNTVQIFKEIAPPIINKFSTKYGPIVNSNDEISTSSGIEFLATQTTENITAFVSTHPAFIKETKYTLNGVPSRPGSFSVNYETGEILVFGETKDAEGTGSTPPVLNYRYRKTYINNLDYTFDSDSNELTINSNRNIGEIEAKIDFKYEDTFAENIDYKVSSHVEVLNERIENRLASDFKIQTKNQPITNVFRIYNETTGEIYSLSRFNDFYVFFDGRQAPRQEDVYKEKANLVKIAQEVLYVQEEMYNDYDIRIFKINLANTNICDSRGQFIGTNFNTSVIFSDLDVFKREFFFETKIHNDIDINLNKLLIVGDYEVDYENGIIYLAVSNEQSFAIGDISYLYGEISTKKQHVLSVNNIYRLGKNSITTNYYGVESFGDKTVKVSGLNQCSERFINDDPSRILYVGMSQSGEDGIIVLGENIFTSNSATFSEEDVGRILTIGSSSDLPIQQFYITGIINTHQVLIDDYFITSETKKVWYILDNTSGNKIITLKNNIISINGIYLASDIYNNPRSSIINYFNAETDYTDENIIYLSSSNLLEIGNAIVVDYNYGNLTLDYKYLKDEIIISYEYGNNSLDWSISDTLKNGDEYYVSYKYGALREPLLSNFGSLTQIKQLTTFSSTLDREVYRSVVGGALQSFIKGPTIPSIKELVKSFTGVEPEIKESAFESWVLGRDYLYPNDLEYNKTPVYDIGKFQHGLLIDNEQFIKLSSISNLKINEGTIETWIRPMWDGFDNDSEIEFDLSINNVSSINNIYIGFSATNPSSIPFVLSKDTNDLFISGIPYNINDGYGFFIWFDETQNNWNLRWRGEINNSSIFSGNIKTSGEFFNITRPIYQDGYEINEISDSITSSKKEITFNAVIDGYDEARVENSLFMDGFNFSSGDFHYIFDCGESESANRLSLYKDGTGYLNFQVIDNKYNYGMYPGVYNLSTNIRDWNKNSLYHVAVSWKFNSPEKKDEMHLFIDGQEVPCLFRYGGNPKANSNFNFGDIAEETIIINSTKPIYGKNDGITQASSNLFISESSDFSLLGVVVGDYIDILDDSDDKGRYTITGVGTSSLSISGLFSLSVGNIKFSINSSEIEVDTPVNYQDFIVLSIDNENNEIELNGLDSVSPDYAVSRESGQSDYHQKITIYNGVSIGDTVKIKSLGLVFKNIKEKTYVYGNDTSILRANIAAPVSLSDVKITKIILDKTLIDQSNGFLLGTDVIGSVTVDILEKTFINGDGFLTHPSNDENGRSILVSVYGVNIDFDFNNENKIIINGETENGIQTETIYFNSNSTKQSSIYWTKINYIDTRFLIIDTEKYAGTIFIKEVKPITEYDSLNTNAVAADIVDFDNGVFILEKYGQPNEDYMLKEGFYEIIYPTYLSILLDHYQQYLYIGSDLNKSNNLNAILDDFRILNYMDFDTRIGETLPIGDRNITTDYNSLYQLEKDSNTLLLLNFNQQQENIAEYYDRHQLGFKTTNSININFQNALLVDENPYIIDNASSIFINNEGTIEFWISPLDDLKNEKSYKYFIDISSLIIEEIESTTKNTIILPRKAKQIEYVRLYSDQNDSGTDYFYGGSLSQIDSKTITLGIPLPSQNTKVKVAYVPINGNGDRISIYKDPDGFINFFMRASGIDHVISIHIDWTRLTWHRIMAMWKTNSVDNKDRLRLFVDGEEKGTIKYGTGLLYGSGIVYGQSEVRSGFNRFVVDNIDLNDTFSKIYIGTDVYKTSISRSVFDNIRFSNKQRTDLIKTTINDVIDIGYQANVNFITPVVWDIYTTGLYDFDNEQNKVEFFTKLINSERGIFRFEITVIDSFDKVIGNSELESLLFSLINTLKPANSEVVIKFQE